MYSINIWFISIKYNRCSELPNQHEGQTTGISYSASSNCLESDATLLLLPHAGYYHDHCKSKVQGFW